MRKLISTLNFFSSVTVQRYIVSMIEVELDTLQQATEEWQIQHIVVIAVNQK